MRIDKKHRLYARWYSINNRCNRENDKSYHRYGGRGIKNLFKSFEHFVETMFPTFVEGMSLDRIDNNGHYEPSNCKWSTTKEQSRNTSSNRFLEYEGRKITLIELCEITGIKPGILAQRLDSGLSVEESVKRKVKQYKKYYYKGIELSIYCKENNIKSSKIVDRVNKRGMTVEQAIETPVKMYSYNYKGMSLKKYCKENNISYDAVLKRLAICKDVDIAVTQWLNKHRNNETTLHK